MSMYFCACVLSGTSASRFTASRPLMTAGDSFLSLQGLPLVIQVLVDTRTLGECVTTPRASEAFAHT